MMAALHAIRVLDVTRFYAGPFCPMLLGDLGAEVIKIEEPKAGDGQRALPPSIGGQGYPFLIVNRNKKGITLNLKAERGKEIFKEAPQFATPSTRVANVEQVDALVEEWTKTKTAAQLSAELEAVRVPCAPILDIDKVANDPHLLAREMVSEVDQPGAGRIKVPGSVFKLSATPGKIKLVAPLLGQHNEEVYCGLLGYPKEEIASLAEEGII